MSHSPQNMLTDTSSGSRQSVLSHGLTTANCESSGQSQQRHFDAEGNTTASNGWIADPVQTFGLTVEPFSLKNTQV